MSTEQDSTQDENKGQTEEEFTAWLNNQRAHIGIRDAVGPKQRPTRYGWRNYETWSIALWIQQDLQIQELCLYHRDRGNYYLDVVKDLYNRGITTNPEGIEIWSSMIDSEALDAMIYKLNETD